MTIEVYNGTTYIDLTQYLDSSGFEGSEEMISGPNADRAMNKTHILDDLGYEKSFSFTTRALSNTEAITLEAILRQRPFQIRTDYYSSSAAVYTVICNNIKKAVYTSGPAEKVKLSGTLTEK